MTGLKTCVACLQTGLQTSLPGREAQFQMAPLDRRMHMDASSAGSPHREAAVLALFYPDDEGTARLLLTVRPDGMKQHAGQVALPGGRREKGESLEQTALRETHEEVHVHPSRITLLGQLTPLYVIPSRYQVHPFVGYMKDRPDLSARSSEVADMFGVTWTDLAQPERRKTRIQRIGGVERDVPFFDFDPYTVWGATAMMLAELAALLHTSTPS